MEYRDGKQPTPHSFDEVSQMADWLMRINQGDSPRLQQRPEAPRYSHDKAYADAKQLLDLRKAALDTSSAEESEILPE